jgi:hypothetical protein
MSVHALGTLLAGIAFDPNIRGVLVVLVAVAVLIGGVWLLLSTNLGSRLGFLVTLTALFGWMTLMSAVWAAYGIGLVGEGPSWTVQEINTGDLDQAQIEAARTAPRAEDLPAVDDLLAENPDVAAAFDEGVTVRIGDVADADPELVPDINDWEVVGSAELGEPQTAADEALTASDAAVFETTGDYVVLRGFEQGGKPEREGDGVVDRVTNKISNTLQITHPTHYAVVQVQASRPTEVPEGAAPLPPTPDPDQPVISVIMVRNLGNLRLPPFILTVVFGALFAFTAWLLHERDRVVMANRAGAGGA